MASGGLGMSENVMGENLIGEYVVVFCTTASNEADRIAGTLVEERLAACVNIASVRSCYRWEEKVARDTEELMIIKTERRMVDQIMKLLPQMHSYSVPEIIVLPIREGFGPYLDWISGSIAGN